jgi:hypothetical protein
MHPADRAPSRADGGAAPAARPETTDRTGTLPDTRTPS